MDLEKIMKEIHEASKRDSQLFEVTIYQKRNTDEMNHVQLTVKRKNLHALIESMIDSGAEFHVRREGAR